MEDRDFYRNAKQKLGLTACHAQSKVAHEAHIEMLFMVETLLTYANWELSKDGTITLTHGEMIREIINTTCCVNGNISSNFIISHYNLIFTFTQIYTE